MGRLWRVKWLQKYLYQGAEHFFFTFTRALNFFWQGVTRVHRKTRYWASLLPPRPRLHHCLLVAGSLFFKKKNPPLSGYLRATLCMHTRARAHTHTHTHTPTYTTLPSHDAWGWPFMYTHKHTCNTFSGHTHTHTHTQTHTITQSHTQKHTHIHTHTHTHTHTRTHTYLQDHRGRPHPDLYLEAARRFFFSEKKIKRNSFFFEKKNWKTATN